MRFPKQFVAAIRAGIAANVSFSAAAVAFYLMMGLVPLLVACLLVYGLAADAGDVIRLIDRLDAVLPPESLELVQSVAMDVVLKDPGGWTLVAGFAVAMWSGSKATEGLIRGLHTAYRTVEKRGIVGRKMTALGLSLVGVIGIALLALLLVILPLAVSWLRLEGAWNTLSEYLRWPMLVLISFVGLMTIYRYGVKAKGMTWRMLVPGACLAAGLSTAASGLFTWYASGIANFGKSYGSLAAVILLLLWCYLNALVALIGAHFNAVRQADGDS